MTALTALFGTSLGRLGLAIVALVAVLAWARWDAARDAETRQVATSLQRQETAREGAAAAARDAERAGAGRLLDTGRF